MRRDPQSVDSILLVMNALVYSRMQSANVATKMHSRLEMITGCPLNSRLSSETVNPGGGGMTPTASRMVTRAWGTDSREDIMAGSMVKWASGPYDACSKTSTTGRCFDFDMPACVHASHSVTVETRKDSTPTPKPHQTCDPYLIYRNDEVNIGVAALRPCSHGTCRMCRNTGSILSPQDLLLLYCFEGKKILRRGADPNELKLLALVKSSMICGSVEEASVSLRHDEYLRGHVSRQLPPLESNPAEASLLVTVLQEAASRSCHAVPCKLGCLRDRLLARLIVCGKAPVCRIIQAFA